MRTGSVKNQRIEMRMEKKMEIKQDDCRYIPNILYSFAPNPCPHSVSSAPLRPI
ncbi:hypothetical protein Hdeb2414_s0001g00018141 [Helianthus debilis subsp. tardiflorus]